MFRNPRENRDLLQTQRVGYSTGRPPSPQSAALKDKHSLTPRDTADTAQQVQPMAARAILTPTKLGPTQKTNRKKAPQTSAAGRPNASILNFFKKAEKPETSLFVSEESNNVMGKPFKEEQDSSDSSLYGEDDRFQENNLSIKRQRMEDYSGEARLKEFKKPDAECIPPVTEPQTASEAGICLVEANEPKLPEQSRRLGPFATDSDSEDEGLGSCKAQAPDEVNGHAGRDPMKTANDSTEIAVATERTTSPVKAVTPAQKRSSSHNETEGIDEFVDLDNLEDDPPDEDEEVQERQWAAMQRELEMSDALFEGELEVLDMEELGNYDDDDGPQDAAEDILMPVDDHSPSCPVCNVSLSGTGDVDVSVHVNNCLDGNPSPLPDSKPSELDSKPRPLPKFKRNGPWAKPAKPGQQNPFSLASSSAGTSSAFSRLMSNHAEDLAWKSAAASEAAARGKPSYLRTCPFYKILPGFSTCVDAFRYGAVEGCQAYFLSHFHSDHYIGLTGTWCHGPIYCSRVTANLVKQQLRVDPKYVVALEWEEEREVPGTNGVHVTMIPANHCPGSSLFLFEKVTGKGQSPRKQRVLHCGDFRACRAHVEHPLLRPDVLDCLSGKMKEQKIDVCYLDTTYLNPKYAFPSQEEVIKACADMCVSLNGEFKNTDDSYETMKRERAGSGMVQFLQGGCSDEPKIKLKDPDPTDGRPASASRGRLLVIVGTYSIGKERICLGIARALNSKIYAPPAKQRICAALEDPELATRLTSDPREAQVHMTPLFEIRAETLDEYLRDYRDAFSRAVGFRPSGWNYRPPNSRFVESPAVSTVLYGSNWKSGYSMRELAPQRGSTRRAACFGVPYSEHSSFRELTMFCCALRIEKVIPTVNVGSAKSRERMRQWVDRWTAERKKTGLFKAEDF